MIEIKLAIFAIYCFITVIFLQCTSNILKGIGPTSFLSIMISFGIMTLFVISMFGV
jgi:hypothetical protein